MTNNKQKYILVALTDDTTIEEADNLCRAMGRAISSELRGNIESAVPAQYIMGYIQELPEGEDFR